MMYSKSFVVSIKNNHGEILRESREKEVFLPYCSTYSIRLKNNNSRRAVATIRIDGTDVMGGNQVVVPAHSHVDLDRFCIDGNLRKGNKFEFVPLSDSRVQDPTSGENGIILVRFQLEKSMPTPTPVPPVMPYHPWGKWDQWDPRRRRKRYPWWDTNTRGTSDRVRTSDCSFAGTIPISSHGTEHIDNVSNAGATIEGARSDQSFYRSYIGKVEDEYVEISLILKSSAESITVKNTRKYYCPQCGRSQRFSNTYCSNCGTNLKA